MTVIYKIAPTTLWREAEAAGVFAGSPDDRRDGFIHCSTAEQLPGTAARYFAGAADLVLAAIAVGKLAGPLRWEPSGGGALFPHLYAPLDLGAILWVKPLPLGPDGRHVFPEDL